MRQKKNSDKKKKKKKIEDIEERRVTAIEDRNEPKETMKTRAEKKYVKVELNKRKTK